MVFFQSAKLQLPRNPVNTTFVVYDVEGFQFYHLFMAFMTVILSGKPYAVVLIRYNPAVGYVNAQRAVLLVTQTTKSTKDFTVFLFT